MGGIYLDMSLGKLVEAVVGNQSTPKVVGNIEILTVHSYIELFILNIFNFMLKKIGTLIIPLRSPPFGGRKGGFIDNISTFRSFL